MTQNPYDQLSKQLLEELLAPLGTVQRSLEIPGEAKFVDLWFQPNDAPTPEMSAKGLLGKIAQTPCLLEPYRNPPTRLDVHTCLLKLFWVQDHLRRQTSPSPRTVSPQEAILWIIATSISKPLLKSFGGQLHPDWGAGFYFADDGFCTVFVAVDQLPKTQETLILRILGRGPTQQ